MSQTQPNHAEGESEAGLSSDREMLDAGSPPSCTKVDNEAPVVVSDEHMWNAAEYGSQPQPPISYATPGDEEVITHQARKANKVDKSETPDFYDTTELGRLYTRFPSKILSELNPNPRAGGY